MFNIDFEDSRVKSTLRTLQYVVLTVLVVVGTIILVFAGQGYDLDPDTGRVIKNGLILVNSVPENATVSINDKPESDLTPSSFPVPDGFYQIRIDHDGYRSWSKQVQVTGSEVEWLYYPLLIPNELSPQNLTVFLKPEFIGVSPSGQDLLVRQKSNKPTLTIVSFSLSGVSNEQTLTLPSGLLELGSSSQIGSFGFEGWASDNRHVLLTHTVGKQTEYIWLDVEQLAQSRNLSQEFDLGLKDVRFINGDEQQLYAVVNNDLRHIDLGNDTISTPIVRNLGRYVLYKDKFVVYINGVDGGSQLGLIEDDNPPSILQDLSQPANNYRLEFAEFDNAYYLGLLDIKAGQMSLTTNPNLSELGTANTPLVFNLKGAKFISFSRNGQFITMQSGQKFLTYDLDRKRRSSFEVDFELGKQSEAMWLDGYRLGLVDSKNLLHMFEFDGGNTTGLVNVNPAFPPMLNTGQNVLYSLSPTAEGGRVFLQGTDFTAPAN